MTLSEELVHLRGVNSLLPGPPLTHIHLAPNDGLIDPLLLLGLTVLAEHPDPIITYTLSKKQ